MRAGVAQRPYQRMRSPVLAHEPTPPDLTTFVGRLKTALTERDWGLQGITTEGAPLYPEPMRPVLGAVAHQRCTFQVLQALTPGLLRTVAAERRRWAHSQPKGPRGARRPKRRRHAAWPAKVSRRKRRSGPCSRGACCWSNVVASPASARHCWPSLGGCLRDAHGVRSGSICRRCVSGGAARRPPSRSCASCGRGASGARGLGTLGKRSLHRPLQRRSPFSMTRCDQPPPRRSRGVIAATARGQSVCTAFGVTSVERGGLLWT